MSPGICITGIGAVCHLAYGIDALWERLMTRNSGLKDTAPFDMEGMRCRRNTICDPDWSRRRLDERFPVLAQRLPHGASAGTVHGIGAAGEALAMAGLDPADVGRIGLALGTTSGGRFDDFAAGEKVPVSLAAPHSTLTCLARATKLTGPVAQISNACTSSAAAILHAAGMIKSGRADIVLCGGADHARRTDFAGFNALRAMSATACKAFDATRDGMVIGDGSAMLVLENEGSVRARGVPVLAYLDGCGMSSDSFHATRPHHQGLARAVGYALRDAGKGTEEIAYVNCHGTGTPLNDITEASALEVHFTSDARPVLSSTKTTTGHLLGSTAALEAVITVMVLMNGTVPQMAHTETADPAIAFELPVANPIELNGPRALSTTLGFGGSNVCLAFSRVEEESADVAFDAVDA